MSTNDFKVSVSKDFNTSVTNLYNAWTQPEQLKQWWKPLDKNLSEVTNDLNEGGRIEYLFEDNSLIIEGKYIEVKAEKKLVYTWNWHLPKDDIRQSNFQLTVEFFEEDDTSSVNITQENLEDEEGTVVHKQGWEKGLNDLEEFLKHNN